LAPDWDIEEPTRLPCFYMESDRSNMGRGGQGHIGPFYSNTWRVREDPYRCEKLKVGPYTKSDATIYFDTAAEREEFIVALHAATDRVREVADKWWHDNPPCPGDNKDQDYSILVEPVEAPATKQSRTIRLPADRDPQEASRT
jgi:hypothetical protein